ncbi:hypothetical protein T439DRAFT_355258 [Meredithblackwellia eburnea MCA 4105]
MFPSSVIKFHVMGDVDSQRSVDVIEHDRCAATVVREGGRNTARISKAKVSFNDDAPTSKGGVWIFQSRTPIAHEAYKRGLERSAATESPLSVQSQLAHELTQLLERSLIWDDPALDLNLSSPTTDDCEVPEFSLSFCNMSWDHHSIRILRPKQDVVPEDSYLPKVDSPSMSFLESVTRPCGSRGVANRPGSSKGAGERASSSKGATAGKAGVLRRKVSRKIPPSPIDTTKAGATPLIVELVVPSTGERVPLSPPPFSPTTSLNQTPFVPLKAAKILGIPPHTPLPSLPRACFQQKTTTYASPPPSASSQLRPSRSPSHSFRSRSRREESPSPMRSSPHPSLVNMECNPRPSTATSTTSTSSTSSGASPHTGFSFYRRRNVSMTNITSTQPSFEKELESRRGRSPSSSRIGTGVSNARETGMVGVDGGEGVEELQITLKRRTRDSWEEESERLRMRIRESLGH